MTSEDFDFFFEVMMQKWQLQILNKGIGTYLQLKAICWCDVDLESDLLNASSLGCLEFTDGNSDQQNMFGKTSVGKQWKAKV